jgi:formamidopyrimidine-DNA glycosylase
MPELPEVETVRRGLEPVLVGQTLCDVVCRRADLRTPFPDDFANRLEGQKVVEVGRRAKYLLIYFEGDLALLSHLGMSGCFKVFQAEVPPYGPHDHVAFKTRSGVSVRYCDPRRFGRMDLVEAKELSAHPLLCGLGPEPLSNAFDGRTLTQRLAGKARPLKTALLDQSVVAGLGNIYVAESLFRAKLSPRRKASSIKGLRAERLARAIRDVLVEAIAAGGTSLRDHRQVDGDLGYFQHQFAVYGRAGEPCLGCQEKGRTRGVIRRMVQSGRTTYYCPICQR